MAHNQFRDVRTGSWNHEYLRICVVYRLLSRGRIGKARACELLAQRRVEKPLRLVELWMGGPLRRMEIAA